ncbi:hypothetical protein Landi51_00751 [Colletotrichum acutatum]
MNLPQTRPSPSLLSRSVPESTESATTLTRSTIGQSAPSYATLSARLQEPSPASFLARSRVGENAVGEKVCVTTSTLAALLQPRPFPAQSHSPMKHNATMALVWQSHRAWPGRTNPTKPLLRFGQIGTIGHCVLVSGAQAINLSAVRAENVQRMTGGMAEPPTPGHSRRAVVPDVHVSPPDLIPYFTVPVIR